VKYNTSGSIPEMSMHVISRKKLREVWTLHPELEKALRSWIKLAERAKWHRFSDVRATIKRADQVGKFSVFDILGNRYRLICVISYEKGKVYILDVLTHAEYDRGQWKRD
jgi:mRNA interferase HigB